MQVKKQDNNIPSLLHQLTSKTFAAVAQFLKDFFPLVF